MPNDKTSTQKGAASDYAPYIAKDATDLYWNSKGNQRYQGNVLAPVGADTQNAFAQTRALAGQPVQGLAEANAYNTGLIANGGMTDDLRKVQGYLDPFASGQYTEDPRLLQSIKERENRAMNGAATQFGGGRYGSAAIGQGMGTAMATAGNDMMLQSNENSRNRQLQASGLLGQMGESARGSALQAGSMLPMLDNLKYAGAERLAGIGDYYQQRAQTEKDANITNFNAKRFGEDDWNNFNQWMGSMQGVNPLTQTKTEPKTSSAMTAVGGALSGAKLGSALGPWGSAIGAAGGGLLGAWG